MHRNSENGHGEIVTQNKKSEMAEEFEELIDEMDTQIEQDNDQIDQNRRTSNIQYNTHSENV